MLEATETFRWVPPLGGVICGRCPGPAVGAGRRSRSMRSSCSRPTSAWTSRPSPHCASPTRSKREVEAAMRDFMRSRWSGTRARWRSSTRSDPAPAPPDPAPACTEEGGTSGLRYRLRRRRPRARRGSQTDMIGWLTTVTPEGQPQTFPIWFLWEDGEVARLQRPAREAERQHRGQPARLAPPQRQRQGRRHRHRRGRGPGRRRDARPSTGNPAYLRQVRGLDRASSSPRPRRWRRSTTSPLRIRPTRGRAFGA